jgi:hypothetical protein
MTKSIFTFLAGVATGVTLGLLVRDKDKQRVKDEVGEQVKRLRNKYDELKHDGEIAKEALTREAQKLIKKE